MLIGGSDVDVEDEWRWMTSGELVTWTAWHVWPGGSTEPNGETHENCMLLSEFGGWYDVSCGSHVDAAICEFSCV